MQLEAALQAVGLVAQLGHELLEQLDFRRAGRLVDAVEEVQPAVAERFGHGLVGGQHELLDDLVALGVFDHVGPDHAALLVQFHLDLGHGQFEGAVGQAALAEGHGQRVHAAQQAADLAASRRRCGAAVPAALCRRDACATTCQELVDLLVGESLRAADRRRVKFGRDPQPLGRKLHDGRFRVPDLARLETGQAVGDQLGQHRQDAVGQIDARGAFQGLAVQRRPRADEVRHVGDMHPQTPISAVELLQRDRVVEIPRVHRIDRDNRLGGEIRAVADRFVERFGLPAGFGQGVFRKLVGQVHLADDRERVDARLSARAEHFGNHALAVVKRRREADHLDHDFIVGPAFLCAGIADVDRLGEQRAVDLHVGRAARLEIGADELVRLAFDDFDDLAAWAGIAVPGLFQLHDDHVAGGGVAGAIGGNVDVFQVAGRRLAAGEADEPEPLLPALKHAGQAVDARTAKPQAAWRICRRLRLRNNGQDEVVRAVADPPAVDQSLDGPFHVGRPVFRQLQLLGDHARLDGAIAGGADELVNRFFKILHSSP